MKSRDISGKAPGGKRTKLSEVLPLDTPFVIQIFPIYACNFKCNYCIFSIPTEKRGFISDKIIMDLNMYKKCVDDMTKFPKKIKVIRFVGIGEPLLHKDIVKMVRYTFEKKVADKIEILTNASLLTNKMTDELLSAGLSRLVVSLQGTTKEKYKKTSQIDLDFTKFIENLKYFYEHKGESVQMYIKIVDSALDDEEDKKRFYEIYGNICDSLAIEHTVPIHSEVDYSKVIKGKGEVTQFGLPVSEVKICPQPFFHLQINPDGKIVPCYSWEYPEIIGDCNKESIVDIWNGNKFVDFRCKMLNGIKDMGKTCMECNIIKYRLFPEDDLKNDAERLKKFYGGCDESC